MDSEQQLLHDLDLLNCQRERESLMSRATSQIEEILQSSMSPRNKRSALYRVRRNVETDANMCFERSRRLNLMFGVEIKLVPADFLPPIDFSTLLKENVIIDQVPLSLPTVDEVIASHRPKLNISSTATTSTMTPDVPITLVPIAVQPIAAITRHTHSELTKNLSKPDAKRKLPYKTYLDLTMCQVFQYIKSFGYGSDGLPKDVASLLPDYNHSLVVNYIHSLRPCHTESQRFVGILIKSDHPVYSVRGNLTSNRILCGLQLTGADAATIQTITGWATALNEIRDGIGLADDKCNDASFKKIMYSEDWSGNSSGGYSILTHLLMWLRKDIPRSIETYEGENDLYHHGYFYDPEYRTSYLTLSVEELLEKLSQCKGAMPLPRDEL